MRRAVVLLPVLALLAGCGGGKVVQPRPQTVIGTIATTAAPAAPAAKLTGDPSKGKAVFASAGCTGCHTLKAAGSTGTVGPNLDQAKPSYELATARVTFGRGAMPSFKGQLSDHQIADVAAYVVKSTGGQAP